MAGAKRAERPLAAGSRATKERRRYAHVLKPEYLAEIERMRLMDDDFNSEEGRHAMCETMEKIKAKGIVEGEARGKRVRPCLRRRSGCLPTESSCCNITHCA